jgi:hypothetical protein
MSDDEYQRTAKALARETRMLDASAARMEEQLLSAMSHQRSVVAPSSDGGRQWLAAAAAIVLTVGSIALWTVSRMTGDTRTSERVGSGKPSTLADVVLPVAPTPPAVTSAKTAGGNRPAHRTQTARVVRPNGFVELPWSAGLPAFESGEIVRVEVPVASLPAYGFDISRGTNRSVEADVLVGQDGLARAMRLVSNSARSTQ